LDNPPNAAEAIKAAGLDWKVVKQPVFAIGGHVIHPVADKYAIVRVDKMGHERLSGLWNCE